MVTSFPLQLIKHAGALLACILVSNSHAAERIETRVEHAARQALEAQAAREGLAKPVVEALVVKTGSPGLPCRQAVSIETLDTRHTNRMRFAAVCPDTDGGRQEFVVRAELSAEVLVAATALPSGRAIRAEDISSQRRKLASMQEAMSDADAAIGRSSRRSLRAGDILNRQLLISPVLVKRGAAVRILVRADGVEISTAGEVLEAGRLDELVRVRNVATGKVIRARVKDSDTVEPADMPMSSHSRG